MPDSLSDLIAGYLQAVERGESPDREALLAAHPDLAGELAAYFADYDKMNQLAAPLRLADPDATVPPDEATASLPKVRYIGDYELLGEIARGGMGVVYRARQVSLNRPVALKMILSGQLASPADIQRFKTEAEAAANLDHPNILPIYEVGEHEGQHYFSMKLIDGGSLAETIRNRLLNEKQAVELLATVCRAVHFAHQRGILHRDLKPANVLIDSAGVPYVTDFGLAKRTGEPGALATGENLTHTGAILGTPAYMAPEQARAERQLSTAVDVYALGAILYELITGQPPFRAATTLDTILQVLEHEPADPRKLNPKANRDLAAVALSCLEKDPAKRYGSAAELADDLDRWFNDEPTRARAPGPVGLAGRWLRRNAGSTAAIVALGLIWGLAMAISIVVANRPGEIRLWPRSLGHPLGWARLVAESKPVTIMANLLAIGLTLMAGWIVMAIVRPRDGRAACGVAAVAGLIAAATAFLYLGPFAETWFVQSGAVRSLHPVSSNPQFGWRVGPDGRVVEMDSTEFEYLKQFLPSDWKRRDVADMTIERLHEDALAANRAHIAYKALGSLAPATFGFFLLLATVGGGLAHYSRRKGRRGWASLMVYLGLLLPPGGFFVLLGALITLAVGKFSTMTNEQAGTITLVFFIMTIFLGTVSALIIVRVVKRP